MTTEKVQAALNGAQQRPADFGAVARAVRVLADHGMRTEAREVAQIYTQLYDGSSADGDAFFMGIMGAPRRRFQPGQTLIREGAEDDDVFIILGGTVGVRRLGVGEIAQVPAGELVGEVANVTGSRRTASVFARAVVDTLVFSPADLAELTRAIPAIYPRLRETVRQRMVAQLMGPDTVFGAVDAEASHALFEQCLPMSMTEGAAIIDQGKPGKGVYIIASGLAQVWTYQDGQRTDVAKLTPGSIFGEISIVLGCKASANVEALTHMTLFVLSRDRFFDALANYPAVKSRVTRMVEKRLGLRDGDDEGPVSGLLA